MTDSFGSHRLWAVSLDHLPADLRSPQDLAPLERLSLLPVAPASSGLSLSRSRWMDRKCSLGRRLSTCRLERAAGLPGGEGLFDAFVIVGPLSDRHSRLFPAAVDVEGDREQQVDEGGDREAGPDRVGAEPAVGREDAAEATGTRPTARMISGTHTAPLARTVPNSTIITPNSRKFQVARRWMWRAIGSAGLSAPMNRASTGRSASVRATIKHGGDEQRLDDRRRG